MGPRTKNQGMPKGPGTMDKGSRDQGPGTRGQEPGTRDQGHGASDQGPETRDHEAGTKRPRDHGPMTMGLGARHQKPPKTFIVYLVFKS